MNIKRRSDSCYTITTLNGRIPLLPEEMLQLMDWCLLHAHELKDDVKAAEARNQEVLRNWRESEGEFETFKRNARMDAYHAGDESEAERYNAEVDERLRQQREHREKPWLPPSGEEL